MDIEKLNRRIEVILENINKFDIDLREDFLAVLEYKPELKELILETKLKKIEYFSDMENKKFIGLYLGDYQISFDFIYGEDEDGLYFDIEPVILKNISK